MTRCTRLLQGSLLAGLIGCSPTPVPTPVPTTTLPAEPTTSATIAPTTPTPTVALVTPGPSTSAASLGEHWETIALPGRFVDPRSAVYGDSKFVIVGTTCPGATIGTECVSFGDAAAWYQDGDAWRAATVADAAGAEMQEVVYNGAYVAIGFRYEPPPVKGQQHVTGMFWRSTDGRAWSLAATLDIGPCGEGCPFLQHLAISGSGLAVLGWIGNTKQFPGGPYRSTNLEAWQRVETSALGAAPGEFVGFAAVGAADPGIVLVTMPEEGPALVLGTSDGRIWTELANLGVEIDDAALIADGQRLVVAGEVVQCGACATQVWSSGPDGTFEPAPTRLGINGPRLAHTGDAFMLVGMAFAAHVYVATDPLRWIEVQSDLALADCEITALAGGPAAVVLLGDSNCGGAWLSRGAARSP